jgi:hypothetical protein
MVKLGSRCCLSRCLCTAKKDGREAREEGCDKRGKRYDGSTRRHGIVADSRQTHAEKTIIYSREEH